MADEFGELRFIHRVYMDAKHHLLQCEREVRDAKEECLRAGMAHAFAGDEEFEIHNLRQELALRVWEEAAEMELNAKYRLHDALKLELERRHAGNFASD